MKMSGSHNIGVLILFLAVGGILGGVLGEILTQTHLDTLMPFLYHHYEIFDIQNVNVNLYVLEVKFGIHFAPNLLSLIGIIIAVLLFRHIG